MSMFFSASEVFDIAEQIERNGAEFYRKAADTASDHRVRALFHRLALLEQDHEVTFQELRTQLLGPTPVADWTDADQDAVSYLRALAGAAVFGANPAVLRGGETADDVLRLAIGFEKDAIAYYAGLKEALPPGLDTAPLDALIKEEMRHVTMLTSALTEPER
ncbi:MAG: hypothetical protein AMXMBFR64_55560 [Myxococcales bacterium]